MSRENKIIIVFSVVCVFLQLILAPNIAIGSAQPNFILVALLVSSIYRSQLFCVSYGFGMGLLCDLVGNSPVGSMSFILAVAGFILVYLRKFISSDVSSTVILVLTIAAFLCELIAGIFLILLGQGINFGETFLYDIIPSTIYNALAITLAYFAMRRAINGKQHKQLTKGRLRFR